MMAQPALLQVNGMPGLAHRPDSPMAVPSKRKREASDDAPAEAPIADNNPTSEKSQDATAALAATTTSPQPQSSSSTPLSAKEDVDNFFHALQPLDELCILQRPIPGDPKSSTAEPNPKRQKSEDPRSSTSSIADKVASAGYDNIDLFVKDVLSAVKEYTNEMLALPSEDKTKAAARASRFKDKVIALHKNEIYYPNGGPVKDPLHTAPYGGANVLTAWGNTGQPKQLFSSLQKPSENGEYDVINDIYLPDTVSVTKVMPAPPSAPQPRAPTLGELFPAPRNLPPLQPPKAPKNVTRDKELGFYYPELSKRSPSRASVYSFQNVNTGHYLDYSNATPPSQTKTKQRERAQSLAGVKPSTRELEMSEMEALFRGSFSSFAPTKDDSKAVVPAGTLGRMWWQSAGYRQFQRLADSYRGDNATEEVPILPDVDVEYLEEAITRFDEMAIDPSLEKAIAPAKSKEEMDTDDLLQEVSDLIQALDSYQRNRNLTMPTTQNRHATTDPANGDILRTASTAQPSEDEVMTYEMLKTQLALIIGMLPPHAVAKLHGTPDGDLLVSKRLEIRSDTYNGIMDEDESSIRAKHQQQQTQQPAVSQPAVVSMPRTTPHRTPSVSGPVPGTYGTPASYPASQYTQQSRPPMPNQQYYGQTPVRQPGVNMPPRPTPGMPQQISQPHRTQPAGQPYTTRPGGYPNYASQMYKPQAPYGTPGYGPGTPQSRMPQHSQYPGQHPQQTGYGQVPPGASPSARYAQPQYPTGYPHQQQQPMQQQQPQQQAYHGYPNGTPVGQRPMPQQIPNHQQYSQSPRQQHTQHRPPYGSPVPQPQMHPSMQRQYAPQSQHPMAQQSPAHLRSGYHTVMNEHQHHSIVERAQAQARQSAHEKTLGITGGMPAHGGAGLAGIGLGGGMNHHRVTAARATMPTNSTPSPRMHPGQPMPPGGGQQQQAPVNGATYHGQQQHMYSQQHQQQQQHMPNPNPTPSPVPMQSPHPPPHGVSSPQPRPLQ